MITINAPTGSSRCVLELGKQGENAARQIIFDISGWPTLYGEGTVVLLHQRSGDAEPYPVATTEEDGSVAWTVSSDDTAQAGKGRAELQYIVESTLAKSITYCTHVVPALGGLVGGLNPETGWVAALLAEIQEMYDEVSGISEDDLAAAVAAYMEANPVTVETTDAVEEDNTLPVTSGGVYTVVGNIEALMAAL